MPNDSAAIIRNARKNGLAVPAFNIPYLPMAEPVMKAVRDEDAFAFIAVARLEWIKFSSVSPQAVYREFSRHYDPGYTRMHLDHVPVIDEDNKPVDYMPIIKEALDTGYHSVMVDGSRLPLAENIEHTRRAVLLAHEAGAPCEAELGAVMGHESGPLPGYEELFSSGQGFTDAEEAGIFAERTRCDWLSVAVGNIHGAVAESRKHLRKTAAKIDIAHLEKIARAAGIPLVLHGGSGVIQHYVLSAISRGIAKVNIATEIRQAYENTMAETGSEPLAARAVYEKTVWILRDYLKISGRRSRFLEGTA